MNIYPPCEKLTGGPSTFCKNLLIFSSNFFRTSADCFVVINAPKKHLISIIIDRFVKNKFMILRLGSPLRSNLLEKKSILYDFKYLPSFLFMVLLTIFANDIVVQSNFTLGQWRSILPKYIIKKFRVIYNPQSFSAILPSEIDNGSSLNLISVEGNQPSPSNSYALDVFNILYNFNHCSLNLYGLFNNSEWRDITSEHLFLNGLVTKETLFEALNHSHVYICSDNLTSSCPNSAIEALSFGLKVLAPVNTPAWELNSYVESYIKDHLDQVDVKKARIVASAILFDPFVIFESYFSVYCKSRSDAL